jgi:hypothetical protein
MEKAAQAWPPGAKPDVAVALAFARTLDREMASVLADCERLRTELAELREKYEKMQPVVSGPTKILVNGARHNFEGDTIAFEQVAALAELQGDPPAIAWQLIGTDLGGSLHPGQKIGVVNGIAFSAIGATA